MTQRVLAVYDEAFPLLQVVIVLYFFFEERLSFQIQGEAR